MAKKTSIVTYTKGRAFQVKLRGKRQAKGLISLYLDYYLGATKDKEGKTKDIRKFEFLKIHIKDNPQDEKERELNKESMELALNIRAKRESDLKHSGTGFVDPHKKRTNFIDYYQNFLDTYKNKDKRLVKYSFEKFKDYVETDFILPTNINENLVRGFRDYLRDNLNGETPYNYFTKFKKVCKQATKEHIFTFNPAEEINIKRPEGVKKEILSFKEIEKLAKTPCSNKDIKLAFLFCLNTGLRHVDAKDLKWQHIDFENQILKKKQTKVKDSSNPFVYVDLNNNALQILKLIPRGKPNENVFTLPTIEGTLKTLKNWVGSAGITKNITWHSARHSFATNLLLTKADIKTVSGLLGHSGLKHTQKYTHLVDEIKKQAVNNLPKNIIE